jgi:hypothetical protein
MAAWTSDIPAFRKEINGEVLLPGDQGYEDSLQRWSATCVKPAVSTIYDAEFRPRLTHITDSSRRV